MADPGMVVPNSGPPELVLPARAWLQDLSAAAWQTVGDQLATGPEGPILAIVLGRLVSSHGPIGSLASWPRCPCTRPGQ